MPSFLAPVRVRSLVFALVGFLAADSQSSATPLFIPLGLGFIPGESGADRTTVMGISADGSVVVGIDSHFATGAGRAWRWTLSGGYVFLDDGGGTYQSTGAFAVTSDGSVIVGYANTSPALEVAAYWDPGGSIHSIGDLGGGSLHSYADAVSDDGSVIAGLGHTANGSHAFAWTQASGITQLDPGSADQSDPAGVSGDGRVIVGYRDVGAPQSSAHEAFSWTAETGMVGLGFLPNTPGLTESSNASAASYDGSVIVGQSTSANADYPLYAGGGEAFLWTPSGGMVGLGDLPGGFFSSLALDVTADGKTVVGSSHTSVTTPPGVAPVQAFIWDPVHGMRLLQDVLASEYGLDLSDWILSSPGGISADGQTMFGIGINPSNELQYWAVFLPEPELLPNSGPLRVSPLRG